uniref:Transposase n=1 Tax=Acrobeloides nanus TaxID=290746 RepID=A0A914CKZ5_9BILA
MKVASANTFNYLVSFTTSFNIKPPNSKKFTKLLQEYIEDIKQLQMAILKDCEDVSMTTDIWTTKNCRNSYMATFVHFLTEDFQKKKILIGFSSLGNLGHDGNTIKNISEQCLSNFGLISNQVITFVADDSSANIKAAFLLGVQWYEYSG